MWPCSRWRPWMNTGISISDPGLPPDGGLRAGEKDYRGGKPEHAALSGRLRGCNPYLTGRLCRGGRQSTLAQLPSSDLTEVDRKVAQLIVAEIPNGACLQLGIGGMPNAVGMLIGESDLKDLGVHTEMYVDAFVDLSRQGKITARGRTSTDSVRCSLSAPERRSCTILSTTTRQS